MGKTISKTRNVEKQKRIPEDIAWKDTIKFVPPITCGRVIKVYDGDTITIASMLPYKGSKIYRFPVRLNGIDTPEMRTKDENEKTIAIKARDSLSDLINHELVTLENTGNDKYGRLLADVWFGNINVNKWMLNRRFAVPYDGGTKKTPVDWVDFYENGNLF